MTQPTNEQSVIRCPGRRVAIASLVPDPENCRVHPDSNREALRESLRRFGQRRPIVVRGNTIIAGNGLWQEAIGLGFTEIAVADADDLSEEEATAYALVDNQTSDLSYFDSRKVERALEGLALRLPSFDPQMFKIERALPNSPIAWEMVLREPPKMTWVLVGIPTLDYADVASTVDLLRQSDKVKILEMVCNAESREAGSNAQDAEQRNGSQTLPPAPDDGSVPSGDSPQGL
jgi:hypothetical protein